MKRKKFLSLDVLLVVLAVVCVVLAVLLCVANPWYLVPTVLLLLFLFLLAAFDINHIRQGVRRILSVRKGTVVSEPNGFNGFTAPVAVLDGKKLVWYNEAFSRQFAERQPVMLEHITQLIPGLNLYMAESPAGQAIEFKNEYFTAYANAVTAENELSMVFFVNDTLLKSDAMRYKLSRPAILYIELDTYDEILKQMQESARAGVLSMVNSELEHYIGRTSGFIRRVSAARHIAIVEQQHLQTMLQNRFDILDIVRNGAGPEALVTLSIGVGYGGDTFKQCEEMALQALDMALGRGGDQAAVKDADGFTFFGGVARSVEKRSKVKSRTMANAIRNLIGQSDQVLIMGHKQSDMDCLGAAVGMLRFCRAAGKPASIVLQYNNSMADSLVDYLMKAGYGEDILLPDEALPLAGPDTLLVVVDTHVKYLVESEEIYRASKNVVVIDHHRKMVEHIDNAMVFYHEPYASSASELVSELLQHIPLEGKNGQDKLMPVEAEALMAGIMLDTRTFSLKVGVRTFEAAAYLRRMGAQTEKVKNLFASSLEDYIHRCQLVAKAEVHEECAIAISDGLPDHAEVIVAQAANDLLTIEGIKASFVVVQQQEIVRVSARSMGDVNVQVILEKLGGGGHLTMAGAQIKDATLEQVRGYLLTAITQYHTEVSEMKKTAVGDGGPPHGKH